MIKVYASEMLDYVVDEEADHRWQSAAGLFEAAG